MKYYNKLLLMVVASTMMVSCADAEFTDSMTEKPVRLAQYEYLNAYDALKTYVDRSAYPNFKLGGGVNAEEFMKKELVYSLAASNYDEITAGNAMKYSACVKDDGSMDFSQVQSFIDAAKSAGMTVYGHTLAWHSQQRPEYLNGLIAPDVIPGEPGVAGNGGYCLVLHNEEMKTHVYEAQVFYTFSGALSQDVTYTLTCMAKATEACSVEVYMQGGNQGYPGSFSVGEEWAPVSFSFTPSHGETNKVALNFGKFVGQIYLDDIVITAAGSQDNLVSNGDFEEGNITGWRSWSNAYEKVSDEGEGYKAATSSDGGHCLNFTNVAAAANDWAAQAWYLFDTPLEQGQSYTFTCMAKATSPYTSSIYSQSTGGDPQGYPGSISIGTEWAEVGLTFTPNSALVDKFTFNFGTFEGTISIDNVKFTKTGTQDNMMQNSDFEAGHINGWKSYSDYQTLSEDGKGYSADGGGDTVVEKTPEQKKEIMTSEMDKWIKGMMEACAGSVTTWDAVNEAISGGGNDGEGFYVLQSASNVSEEDAEKNFYWQDYLGNEDYVRIVIAKARQYFEEYGGNPSELKLFINDYNLESDWDDNKKLKSLIHWIEKWESDGITKIDGIGTQMHVSCYAESATQQKKEEHVVKMFELLAASGKLVKISELDMGYVDTDGNSVKTVNITEEQHKAMSEFYKFIVKKYLEIIPVEQQYGITAWAITDSPDADNSYWRRGLPIGLWDLNYNRKHAYAGFADGLAGK